MLAGCELLHCAGYVDTGSYSLVFLLSVSVAVIVAMAVARAVAIVTIAVARTASRQLLEATGW